MTLNKLQIKIKDFKSIANTDGWISLDGKIEVLGKNYIDGGSNGAGKSSILEALYTAVSLCGMEKDSDEQKKHLKKYYREKKYPFEIQVGFTAENEEHLIKATPDGIKEGSLKAKKHLYNLITSFLMQGMANSLIMQETSECKTVISSYFECDEIIDNIIQNSSIVKQKLEDKLEILRKDKTNFECILWESEADLGRHNKKIEDLGHRKLEISNKIDFENIVPYNKQEHDAILSDIEKSNSDLKTVDGEIGRLQEEKYLLKNGVETQVDALKAEKEKKIKDSESSYSLAIGSKFNVYVKKSIKEYNDGMKKEYDKKNKSAIEYKESKINEIKRKIQELEELESEKIYISGKQRELILDKSSRYTKLISNEIEIKTFKQETKDLHDGLLDIVKSTESEAKEKLKTDLSSIKKNGVKKFQEIEVSVFTLKNKPKKKLPEYYVVYNWDVETNHKFIAEIAAKMLDSDNLSNALQDMDSYTLPDVSDLDEKIIELENTDTVKRLNEIGNDIDEGQKRKLKYQETLSGLHKRGKQLQENKEKNILYDHEKETILSIERDLIDTKKLVEEARKTKIQQEVILLKTNQKINRWNEFLNKINKDTILVKNSFKEYVIDLYNERLEPLIDFYGSKVFSFSSKLVVKIGSGKQPSLNGIKFDHTSGGEKSKQLFVFSLAHRDFLGKQRGFNNDYIFCDEVFDGMDEGSRHQSIQFLTQGLVMENVLVISHMEDTTLPHFKRIIVVKDELGTNIKK